MLPFLTSHTNFEFSRLYKSMGVSSKSQWQTQKHQAADQLQPSQVPKSQHIYTTQNRAYYGDRQPMQQEHITRQNHTAPFLNLATVLSVKAKQRTRQDMRLSTHFFYIHPC